MDRRVMGDLINRAVRHHIKHVDHPEDPVHRPFQIEQVRFLHWLLDQPSTHVNPDLWGALKNKQERESRYFAGLLDSALKNKPAVLVR